MKISVVTVSYNSSKTIEQTILSVIKQNYSDLEYIIIDGGSKDGTLEIIEKYRDRINTVVSEPDNGISDAFNKGIKLATGEIVVLINSDDFLNENAIKNVAKFIEENPNYDVYYGNTIVFSEKDEMNYVYKPSENLSDFPLYFIPSHPSMFIAASAYKKYGYYDEDVRRAMDFELLSKMYLNGAKYKYMDIDTTWFRLGGVSNTDVSLTCAESIDIAVRNGVKKSKAQFWYNKTLVKHMILTLLKKLHLEETLRHLIKKQNSVSFSHYWFEE